MLEVPHSAFDSDFTKVSLRTNDAADLVEVHCTFMLASL
jgi:hypothetical protein